MQTQHYDILVIGGGAAGFFSAINTKTLNRNLRIAILERGKEVLGKVKISGGGRCNLTHACFDARELSQYYPRGSRELLGPFYHFGPADTIAWFESRGVPTKTEEDGRMFPRSNSSESIVNCLQFQTKELGIPVFTQQNVIELHHEEQWHIRCNGDTRYTAEKLMLATGSSPKIWKLLAKLGHKIVDPVPSLFTFNIQDPRLKGLAGISVPAAAVSVQGEKLQTSGPLLITHWGLSGPGILKLSAWGARKLFARNYEFEIEVNWLSKSKGEVQQQIAKARKREGKRLVAKQNIFGIPQRLWGSFYTYAQIAEEQRWADLNKPQLDALREVLCASRFQVTGKSTFKEEFVTAGGVTLKEVDFKRFASKKLPNLFMAGEVLNIDALTGGFNFQAAWTGAWIAAQEMVKRD